MLKNKGGELLKLFIAINFYHNILRLMIMEGPIIAGLGYLSIWKITLICSWWNECLINLTFVYLLGPFPASFYSFSSFRPFTANVHVQLKILPMTVFVSNLLNTLKHKLWCSALVVMGRDSRPRGRGFESWYRILDGHFYLYCQNYNVCLKKTENKRYKSPWIAL